MAVSAETPRRKIRVFVSSPGDVEAERRRMMDVIAGLNRRYAKSIEIEGVFWEQTVYPAHATFQRLIADPAECDVVICILWSRLGTPLPADWPLRPGAGGEPYESGTVYEFETALAARRHGPLPDIYVFRRILPPDTAAIEALIEKYPAEKPRILDYLYRSAQEDARQASQMVERFWARWFHSPEKGFIAAFNPFHTADEFAELARRALDSWLVSKDLVESAPDWDIATQGSPYPGPVPFDEQHAAVFCGRERVSERAVRLMRGVGETDFPWLLLTGPSGSGKSSLVRAGLIPALAEETALETWRVATVRPGSTDPVGALAETIAGPDVLRAALAEGDHPAAADLARLARSAPPLMAQPLRRALDRHAEAMRAAHRRNVAPRPYLVLAIDQLEELLLAEPAEQELFGRVLTALIEHGGGRIWAVATLRSDLQEPFLKIPGFESLLTLDRGGSEMKLAAPGADDMRDVIEGPAARAGLSFEERAGDGRSLADELLAAVGAASDALPLLQMTLALLFERRDPDTGRMRWADYAAIGRLDGAIATHAEAVMRSQPQAVQDELGPLLRRLTRPWLSLDGEIELRPSELDGAALQGNRAALAHALVDGRLLVAGEGGRIRIAHEAVLRNWGRAQGLLDADLDLLRLKARLEPQLADWLQAGGSPADEARLIPPGAQLAAAADALNRFPRDELGAALADFIAASVRADRRRRTRWLRALAAISATVTVLAIAAIVGFFYARHESRLAQLNYRIAIDQAAGSVAQLIDGYDAGGISTAMMTELVERSRKTLRKLPGETDDITAARAALLDALSRAYLSLNRVDSARDTAKRENALAAALLKKDPADRRWQRLWADARARLSEALAWQGDLPNALAAARDSDAVIEKLAAAAPNDDDLHWQVVWALERIGDELRSEGDFAGAVATYTRWLAFAEKQRTREPKNPLWPRAMAFAYQRLGDCLLIQRKPAEARGQYQTYLDLISRLGREDPGKTPYLEGEGIAHEGLGDTYLAEQNSVAASTQYAAFQAIFAQLLQSDADNLRWREFYEIGYQRQGEAALQAKDYPAALTKFTAYLKAAQALSAKDPANPAPQYDVANAHEKLGDALREQGNLRDAAQHYQRDLEIMQALTKQNPFQATWQKELATSYQRLGLVRERQRDAVDARAMYAACAAVKVPPGTWAPRDLWPSDPAGYCRAAAANLKS